MLKKIFENTLIALGFQKTLLFRALANTRYLKNTASGMRGRYPRECPNCGHKSFFVVFGTPSRFDAKCPECGSLERHRLFYLLDQEMNFLNEVSSILHFAPEPIIEEYLRQKVPAYLSADLYKPGVDQRKTLKTFLWQIPAWMPFSAPTCWNM